MPRRPRTSAAARRSPVGTAWWRGSRGEWYVVAQVLLIALVLFGPRSPAAWPAWGPAGLRQVLRFAGAGLMVAGALLFGWGVWALGRAITPLPHPRAGAALVSSGPYAFVRHPIYGGLVLLALGFAAGIQDWLALGFAALLVVLLDVKSRREERWLEERHPTYADYRRRVRKLIPFVY
ncbi:MAG TPA: isoprenylcysteine carboxylmethyltransferase family protein [Gemmatimonadales bacterium]|nr:isoprenylcysteine carboxylmethyltransferase family protein [Gemmatimonadales bacterium]